MSDTSVAGPSIQKAWGGPEDVRRDGAGDRTWGRGPRRFRRFGRLIGVGMVAVSLGAVAACSGSSGPGASKTAPSTPATGAPTTTAVPLVPTGVAAAPAQPSPGCKATAAVAPGHASETLSIGGASREYFRYTPPGVPASKPLPVVVDIHGLGSDSDQEVLVSQFEQLAATEQFVVLTPRGSGPTRGWDTNAKASSPDIDFLTAMLNTVEGQVCVDTARVYSTGLSNGGIMSSLLACRMADKVAAVGLVSGIRHPDTCSPSRPVPMMVFWGKQDVVLPFYGGLGDGLKAFLDPKHAPAVLHAPTEPPADLQGFPPVEQVVKQWVATDGCNATPAVAAVGSDVEERIFSGCKGGAVIRFYVISDGGHTWPGSKVMMGFNDPASPAHKFVGTATDQVDATKLIWAFFRSYALTS